MHTGSAGRTDPHGWGCAYVAPILQPVTALADLRAQLARLATPAAAVELAELEPILPHRLDPTRDAFAAAASQLDAPDVDPRLRARLMLRLATLKLVETDLEGADQALVAAGRHAPDARALRFLAGARACRITLRRGNRVEAGAMLVETASALPALDDATEPTWREVTCEVILGIAEVALGDEPVAVDGFAPLVELVAELDADPRRVEVAFAGHQLLAAAALARGESAAPHLRALVALARAHASPADEIEARVTLASVLAAAGEPIGLEEAARTVQIARDRALEHGLTALHRATLLAQAGVLAAHGKTAGALDRTLELARAAQRDGDVAGYVAAVGVMAELYARAGDHVSAFRTIVEANAALGAALGTNVGPLFREHLARLRERVGAERLDRIAADVDRANRLAGQIAAEKP